jgi:transposase
MEERFRFVRRRLEGESMTALCEEFGISRKTGHKIFARYKEHGLEALRDRPRKPRRNVNRLPMPVEALIVDLKRDKPHWGARKLRELLAKRLGDGVPVPARSIIHAVLDRHGLVEHARARRPRAPGTPLGEAAAPNDIWGTDFKGEFRLGDRRWCFPLTATDRLSRFLLARARRWRALRKLLFSRRFAACSRSAACRWRSAPTTEDPSPAAGSTASRRFRSGGCASASGSSASSPAARSRTASTSACI